MKLDLEQIGRLAELSRLDLSEAQLAALQADLSKMMAMATKVQNVDTSKLSGVINVHDDAQPLRADVPTPPARDLSADAAASQDGLVVVPPVLGK